MSAGGIAAYAGSHVPEHGIQSGRQPVDRQPDGRNRICGAYGGDSADSDPGIRSLSVGWDFRERRKPPSFLRDSFAFHISAFSKKWIIPLFAKGIPAAFQQSIPAVSTSFLTSLVSSYGISAIAAYGITGKLETILFYPAMALNMVLTTVTGQCIGGRRCDRAKDYIKVSLIYGCGLLAVLSAVVVLFARPLSGLFVDSEAAAEIVRTYFLIIGIGYILNTAL